MLISPIGLFAKIILASHRLKYTMFSNIFACCGDILSLDRIYPNAKMASIGHQYVSSNCPELGGPVDFKVCDQKNLFWVKFLISHIKSKTKVENQSKFFDIFLTA